MPIRVCNRMSGAGAHQLARPMTCMNAGNETTGSSLAWALYHIHRDDAVRQRVIGELSERLSPSEMTTLPYLAAVIKESQRMNPPVPIVLRG